MLTLVNDHSLSTWTYLLQHKSQTATIISSFMSMVQTQFEGKIKCIRMDNGGEFLSVDFQKLLGKHGIVHQTPYSPQQNGVVEQEHKHLLQLALSLMLEASMSNRFWPYSLLMATNIVNRLPSAILDWRTPYEVLHKKPPDYSLLRVFGCLGYATNVKPHKSKFEARASKCVYLELSLGQKGV